MKAGLTNIAQSRWGDFTGIDNDASLSGPGGTTAWYAGQWTKGTNTFGTWINQLSFTYGQVGGIVVDDCDGSAGDDRRPDTPAGRDVSAVAGRHDHRDDDLRDPGAFNFGYLEAGTYDVVVTPPAGGMTVDAVAGTGGTSQIARERRRRPGRRDQLADLDGQLVLRRPLRTRLP